MGANSIKSRLIKMQLRVGILILVTCWSGFLLGDFLIFKRSVERNLESTAKILGRSLGPALAFADANEANRLLSSLSSETSMTSAQVLDTNGKTFAKFGDEGTSLFAFRDDRLVQDSRLSGTHLMLGMRITQGNETYGTLYLAADLMAFARDYAASLILFVIIFFVALLASFVLAHMSHRWLSEPVVALAETARAITSSGDYSLRMRSEDGEVKTTEVEVLANEFNSMLDQIEHRDSRIRAEKDLAEKANQAKSLFLANMSHELRTPMHGILSFARFGQQKFETAPKEKLKSYFDEIYQSGSRLMALLNDLLDLSKLEAGKVEYQIAEEDFVNVAQSVVSEMKAFAEERNLTLQVETGQPQALGRFDRVRIGQVIRNITSNAIKFSTPGTVIRIEIGHDSDLIRCNVVNRGVGIPADELKTVFDKFVQSSKTKSGAGGTGLGLAICRELVTHHGGRIWAESTPDEETRFCFELPRQGPPAADKKVA